MTLVIRPARTDDAPDVARIYVESWNLGFGSLMPTLVLDANRIDRWRAEIAGGGGSRRQARTGVRGSSPAEDTELSGGPTSWWVAEHAGSVVGLVGIGPSRDPIDPELGELDTIAVDPASWRTGVGTALMRTALEALTANGFREAILWTLANYPRGQRFYASLGWWPDGGVRDDGHQVSFRHDLNRVRPPSTA